ncbi:MAG TPA: hypothetical protein VFG62_08640 [Rhodopila sp.]|jgi:hypothetical protein|nr:hypothetical protein [Rhodopila sp.]
MKKLMILMALACPTVAVAQTPTNQREAMLRQDMETDMVAAMLIGEAQQCGVRDADWTKTATGLVRFDAMQFAVNLWSGDPTDGMREVRWVASTIDNTVRFGQTVKAPDCSGLPTSAMLESLDAAVRRAGH